MASEDNLKWGSDAYEKDFNIGEYLRVTHSLKEKPAHTSLEEVVPLALDCYHKFFGSKIASGDRMLDIGTGPVISHLISASKYYKQIICTDYAEQNINELKALLDNFDSYKAFDWTQHFQHVAKAEGLPKDNWRQLLNRLLSSITKVTHCDVTLPNPIHPLVEQPFDCVSSSYVFEAVCEGEANLDLYIRNAASLLRSGGMWIQTTVLDCAEANCGSKFKVFSAGLDTFLQSLKRVGFDNFEIEHLTDTTWIDYSEASGVAIIKAFKR